MYGLALLVIFYIICEIVDGNKQNNTNTNWREEAEELMECMDRKDF